MDSTTKELSEILNILMAKARITASELSRKTGVTDATIKRIRNNQHANPTLSSLLPLADYFGVTIGQLIGKEPLPENQDSPTIAKTFRKIPVIEWEEAITWTTTENQTKLYKDYIETNKALSDQAFALVMEDDNFQNLPSGTILTIEPNITPQHRDYALVYKQGQFRPSIRQILIDENDIYLKSLLDEKKLEKFCRLHTIIGIVVQYQKTLTKGDRK